VYKIGYLTARPSIYYIRATIMLKKVKIEEYIMSEVFAEPNSLI
jgi:hypothetical protein